MMVQATIVEIEKIVMEEEEVRGTGGLHMVEEADIVEEMMMNLKMRLMTTASHTKFAAEPSMVKSSSGGSRSNFQGTFSGKSTTVPSSKPAASTTTSMGSTSRSSRIQSFKCVGLGHIGKECRNNQVIIVNDDGMHESASEEGIEEDAHGDEDLTYCEFEQGAALEMTQILSV